jgi:membrane protease YdiL (CAAX protease family)
MSLKLKGYWRETQRPVYAAALILPFLCVYHVGTLLLHTTYINGADALIIRILSIFSVRSLFGSALVLLLCFVLWQWRTRASWKIRSEMLWILYLESLCFAFILLFSFGWIAKHLSLALSKASGGIADLVLYCGAGIYEELVFRALLLGLLIAIFGSVFHMEKTPAVVTAVVLGALLFSAFHYIGPSGDTFTLGSFVQRALGGLYFSVLYATRGFGVAAASHAIYDILVGLVLA